MVNAAVNSTIENIFNGGRWEGEGGRLLHLLAKLLLLMLQLLLLLHLLLKLLLLLDRTDVFFLALIFFPPRFPLANPPLPPP